MAFYPLPLLLSYNIECIFKHRIQFQHQDGRRFPPLPAVASGAAAPDMGARRRGQTRRRSQLFQHCPSRPVPLLQAPALRPDLRRLQQRRHAVVGAQRVPVARRRRPVGCVLRVARGDEEEARHAWAGAGRIFLRL